MAAMQPLILMLLMFGVFYFLLIRPQVKRQKKHTSMLDSLKKGDEIVTRGGIIGRITGISDQKLVIELQEKVRVRIVRAAVESMYEPPKADSKSSPKKSSKPKSKKEAA